MRKHILTALLVMLSVVTFGQQWVAIKSGTPSTIQTTLVSSTESQITVNLQVPGFFTQEVTTPRGEANIITVPRTVSTAAAGEPNLPMIAVPALIDDHQHYNIRVVDAQYADFQMEVAPSKGDFPRTINPEDVPYTYGEAYSTNAFFPAQNVGLYEPYILRDFRGQNMVVYPFTYNPISKTLRVYYNMTIEMYTDGISSQNILDRRSNEVRIDPEIQAMYENHFINYSESLTKYTPTVETGQLLIICHDAFMSAMQPFVNWKKQIGRPTTMVGTSTAGTTAAAIKTYIQNQYNANNNITHVLLVGDVAQIPGNTYSAGSYGGKSDNMYGQVAGNDLYNDIIVGRFSAENESHVTTQVNKVIHYERDINASDTWLPIGQGISKNEGAGGGHYGEADYQHIDNIRDDLLDYNYTTVHRDYLGVSGVSSSAAIVSEHINQGVSIINYCNHGSPTSWGVFSYSNSHVNALTNVHKLPIIWSVACNNGQYDYGSQPCFGETWLRANNNNNSEQPTGAIGGMFSYISQPWQPPMYGQDEMVDVLVESYSNNIKRTLGGCSYDGNMKILDQYGQSQSEAKGTYLAWILFGDPTLTLRNAVPQNMNVSHASSMNSTATSFTVNATNGNGALATLTRNNEIMGSATINNGTANITFTAPNTTGTATLTVFGYNKITYIATINITQSTTQYTVNVSANPSNGGNVTGGGTYQEGQSCTVSATANDGYSFVNWTENGNQVSSDADYTFDVTSNRNLVANFQAQVQSYSIKVGANPIEGGSVTGGGIYQEGQLCTVTATPNSGYTFINWTENGSQVSTNASYAFTVTSSRNLTANFQAQPQNYTINVSANPSNGGNVTGGGSYQQGQSCTVTATPNAGYDFTNWTENGEVVSPDANYTFIVNGNRTLVANFTQQQFTITATANPSDGGNVTGGGTYTYGQQCTLTAAPATGYDFVRWTKNGQQASTNANYTFTVTESATYVAQFQLQSFTISVSANPDDAGTVSGNGTYNHGASCTVVATPTQAYNFINWTENGVEVSNEPSFTFTVDANRSLVANFEASIVEIKATVDPEDAASITGTGTYNYGDEVTLTLARNEDWAFVSWTEDGEVVSEEMTYTFIATEDRNLVAHFVFTEGIGENNISAKVYPNPTSGEITLEGENLSHVRIVNAYGQTVYNAKVEGEQVRIDLSNMAKGIYMMHIEAVSGQAVRKIVME
ncbi:MAG: T9SS type A sorting domain-containing protein [Bacteroidales bacterium]|nr:T9SS type A sorting domain-containing protein [Bacteroidales bacterium]